MSEHPLDHEAASSSTSPPSAAASEAMPAAVWLVLVLLVAVVGFFAGDHFNSSTVKAGSSPPESSLQMAAGGPSPVAGSKAGIMLGEHTIADLCQQAGPSVVNIDIASDVALAGLRGHEDPLTGERPPGCPHAFERTGAGSGVIIRPDGYILTSNHVVRQAQKIRVLLDDKRSFDGAVVGRDAFTDLALVKIDASDLPTARFGDSNRLRPGDWAIAIGSPMRLDHTVSLGIISAIGRSLGGPAAKVDLIQTDAAINPGNSGGPLLNIAGQVIGINTAIRSDAQNIGFAVPISIASQVASDLLAHGTASHGYLGIRMRELDDALATAAGVPASTQGVLIAGVAPHSPAQGASMQAGDILQAINGKPVVSVSDVRKLLEACKAGQNLQLSFLRHGELSRAVLRLGEYEESNE